MGGAVARALAAQGHTVFTYGRRSATAIQQLLPNYSQWDLSTGATAAPEVDAVVHCAARVGNWGAEADYRRVNVDGTRAVIQTFSSAKRFVYVSSASVYSGNQVVRQLSEDARVGEHLHNAYATSKVEAEKLVLSCRTNAVILRPHAVYGPGDTTLTPRLLAARRLGWLPVPGNGQNLISVTHIYNFVHAVECVLKSSVTQGVFNIADQEAIRVDDLLRTILQQNGLVARLFYIPRQLAWAAAVASERVSRIIGRRNAPRLTRYLVTHIADEYTLDLKKAFGQLGYAPRFDVHDEPIQEGNRQ